MEHKKMLRSVVDGKEVDVQAYYLKIYPMYIGKKSDNNIADLVSVFRLNTENGLYDEYQMGIKPNTRLAQEVKKLLDATTKK